MIEGYKANNQTPNKAERVFQVLLASLGLILPFSEKIATWFGAPANELIFYIISGYIVLWVTYFRVVYRKKWIAWLYLLPVLMVIGTGLCFHNEMINDRFNQFKKSDQIIGVIIPNFKSPISKEGATFAENLYMQLENKTMKPLQIILKDTTLSLEIQVQKVEGVWDTTEMRIRGRRRKAKVGVIGNYGRYLEKREIKETISDFKVTLLDTLIAAVFKEKQRSDSLYDFIAPIDDILGSQQDSLSLVEKAALPIEYIINTAGNTMLLQWAVKVKGWNRDQTLSTLHKRLSDRYKLIRNYSLACFHHGNSLVRAAMDPQLRHPEKLPARRRIFEEASMAYKESIDSLSSVTSQSLLNQNRPWRIYLNLAWTYIQLNLLTGDSTYLNSAEAAYDSVVVQYPNNRETLEGQHTFLDQRCEEEFVVQKDTSRIKQAERIYSKYQECANKLDIEIRTKSQQPSKEDQEILDKIKENKEKFEAHLKKLRQLQQGV